jgi:hypothetical protein
MKRTGFAIAGGILFACVAAAQSQTDASAGAQGGAQTSVQAGKTEAQGSGSGSPASSASLQNGQSNASLGSGSTINAALSAPIDSKKAKQGDPVNARTTEATKANGKTVIPRDTKLVGHVTQASARAKGDSESSLGIVFDKAVLKNGQEVPLNAAIQALATAQASSAANAGDDLAAMGGSGSTMAGSGRAAGNGALGRVSSTAGGTAGTVTNTAGNAGGTADTLNSTVHSTTNAAAAERGATGGLNAAGQLTSNSRGVFGLQGVNLNSATGSASQGSVITSAGKSMHLDSGTQMLLVTQAATATETPKP